MPNTQIETVLTGEIWKVICINLELENVGLELLNSHSADRKKNNIVGNSSRSRSCSKLGMDKEPLAHLEFLKSTLIYESFSDQSKLIDLFSSEILIIEITNTTDNNGRENSGSSEAAANLFVNILCNPNTSKPDDLVKGLQLELHYKSNIFHLWLI